MATDDQIGHFEDKEVPTVQFESKVDSFIMEVYDSSSEESPNFLSLRYRGPQKSWPVLP